MILHDYFIKTWDHGSKRESFHRIVGRGQTFPSDDCIKTVELAATHEDQTRLGVEVFELTEDLRLRESLTIDGHGQLHLSEEAGRELTHRAALNTDQPKFIIADPPCRRGERRFRIEFGINDQKWLTASVTDKLANGHSTIVTPSGEAVPLPVTNLPLLRLNG